MPEASYARVLCTTSSANTAIGTSAAAIFDTDHSSVVFTNSVSKSIIWDQSAGTFTFSNAGVYHVCTNLITESSSGTQIHTVTFNLNADGAIYTGSVTAPAVMDPVGHTHQRIISVSAGDVLHVKMATSANTAAVGAGSALVINEITSAVYASSTVTTAGTNSITTEFNPYDTDGDGPAFAAAGKVASGITWEDTPGRMTVPSAGRYIIMVTNFHATGETTNSDIDIKLKSGSDVLWTADSRNHQATDPMESTICVIENFAASAEITVTWDIGSGACHAALGATFTMYKLNDKISNRQKTLDLVNSYITVVNKADMTASGLKINPFDEDSYSSADFDTRSSGGITFNSADGTFTFAKEGTYWVIFNSYIKVASDSIVNTIIKVTGDAITNILNASPRVDSFIDPSNRSFATTHYMVAGDSLIVTIDSDSADIQAMPGTSMTIVRVPDWAHKETAGSNLIGDDFTINTFSQSGLSVQHQRTADQVPFSLGVKGPMSLRGKVVGTTAPYSVTKGQKKN